MRPRCVSPSRTRACRGPTPACAGSPDRPGFSRIPAPRTAPSSAATGSPASVSEDGDMFEVGQTFYLFRDGVAVPPDEENDVTADGSANVGAFTLYPPFARKLRELAAIARSAVSVIIHGETGTGKELLARAVHAVSDCRGAFVPVNCGAIPESLVESELFGVRRGAYSDARERLSRSRPQRERRDAVPGRDRRPQARPADGIPARASGERGRADRPRARGSPLTSVSSRPATTTSRRWWPRRASAATLPQGCRDSRFDSPRCASGVRISWDRDCRPRPTPVEPAGAGPVPSECHPADPRAPLAGERPRARKAAGCGPRPRRRKARRGRAPRRVLGGREWPIGPGTQRPHARASGRARAALGRASRESDCGGACAGQGPVADPPLADSLRHPRVGLPSLTVGPGTGPGASRACSVLVEKTGGLCHPSQPRLIPSYP